MVIPTNYKEEDAKQGMNVRAMMIRVSFPCLCFRYESYDEIYFKMTTPTPMSPPGISLLGSVREIFELAGVIKQLDSGDLRPKLLDISPHEEYIVDKDVPSKKNQESVPLLPLRIKSVIEDDSENEETENNEAKPRSKAAKVKVDQIKQIRQKSVPILASKGEPDFEIGIKKALSLKMFPVVIVGGGGSHAMCAYQYDDQTQQEMLYIQSYTVTDQKLLHLLGIDFQKNVTILGRALAPYVGTFNS